MTSDAPAATGGRRRQQALYAAAALFLVIGTLDLGQHYHLPAGAPLLLTAARAAPLLLCRRSALRAWYAALAGCAVTAAVGGPVSRAEPWPWAVSSLAVLIPLLALAGAREARRRAVAAWGSFAAVGAVLLLAFDSRGSWGAWLVVAAVAGGAAALGDATRGRRRATAELARERQVSEAERERRTLLEERARIARELHDVVAHHMSVITVQADSAPYRLSGLPPEVVEEFAGIAAAARGSLAEMRRLLGALRSAGGDPDRGPQPGLADLEGLVGTAARAGVAARLAVAADAGAFDRLPRAVDLSAYRIVQEALANVVRHAPGAQARITVALRDGALRITVQNSPPGRLPGRRVESAVSGGHGLVGMRERVRLLDGSLDTGPLPGGGYRVDALLPLDGPQENDA